MNNSLTLFRTVVRYVPHNKLSVNDDDNYDDKQQKNIILIKIIININILYRAREFCIKTRITEAFNKFRGPQSNHIC